MIVSNTTPISNFLHLNQIEILKRLFNEIHIPQAVKQEIEDFFVDHKDWKTCLHDGFIVVHDVKNSYLLNQFLRVLHSGEAEALCLYVEHHARLCLVDDTDARAFAKVNNIRVSGTLGILIQAKNVGIIDAVKPLMDALKTPHHFWISEKMYKHVLLLCNE